MTMISDMQSPQSKEDVINSQKDHVSSSRDSGLDNQSNSSAPLDDAISIYEDAVDITPSSSVRQSALGPNSMEGWTETERLRSLKKILDTFFNNNIHEAESLVEQHTNTCVNHSHVKMYFSAMSAMMTLDPVSSQLIERVTGDNL